MVSSVFVHGLVPMQSAFQRPIGTNTVHLAGAGLVPDVGTVVADVQTQPDLLTLGVGPAHLIPGWDKRNPDAIRQRLLQSPCKFVGASNDPGRGPNLWD